MQNDEVYMSLTPTIWANKLTRKKNPPNSVHMINNRFRNASLVFLGIFSKIYWEKYKYIGKKNYNIVYPSGFYHVMDEFLAISGELFDNTIKVTKGF